MSIVGIVANPASGKDIRRLVAHGSVFDNNEKSNILQRILLALDALGVRQVVFMPDYYGMSDHAGEGLRLSLEVSALDMPVTGTEADSTEAGRRFAAMGAGAVIVLGGDGTNRVVAKGCGSVPMISVSTGTNNVFSSMIEGTVAGLAAGLLAQGLVDAAAVAHQTKRLDVYVNDIWVDMALIDAVATSDLWIGSRAIWEPAHIREILLTQALPGSIGMASVGACLQPIGVNDGRGLYVAVGQGAQKVLAPVAPGLVTEVPIREYQQLEIGDEITLEPGMGTVALDGERTIEVYPEQTVKVKLSANGPRVVEAQRCIQTAIEQGVFTSRQLE
jgi:predicted polyphosphate/ATP-dependent NAD kinase